MEPKHGVSPAIPSKSPDHSLVITNGINLGFNPFTRNPIPHEDLFILPGKLNYLNNN
jgi:hypothetical protein